MKAYERLSDRYSYQLSFSEILDAFDGPLTSIEQSITGNFDTTYKKFKSIAKWVYSNVENKWEQSYRNDNDEYQWTQYL